MVEALSVSDTARALTHAVEECYFGPEDQLVVVVDWGILHMLFHVTVVIFC